MLKEAVMRRGRIWIFLILIVVIALGAVLIVFSGILGGGGVLSTTPPPTPEIVYAKVIVAAQSIQRGTEITSEMLGTIDIPQEKLVDVMITDPTQVIGKLAKYPLEPGVPITNALLAGSPEDIAQSGSEASRLIPPGLTAITIPISRLSAVGYALRDGDRVDVIASLLFVDVDPSFQSQLPNVTYTITGTGFLPDALPILTATLSPLCAKTDNGFVCGESGAPQGRVELDATLNQAFYIGPRTEQRPRLVSQRVLQNVQVLKVGTFTLPGAEGAQAQPTVAAPAPDQAQAPATTTAVERPDIITLIVPPQDAVTLTYLMYSNAKLTLTLRGLDDQTRVDTEAATLQFLLSQYAIPVPAKLPYAIHPQTDELFEPLLPNDIVPVQ
jgi:Flp pilus assembly protein CpaB